MSTEVKNNKLFEDETIVAIATANGIGSISIVRLSGINALEIAKKISQKTNFQPRLASLTSLYSIKNEVIDEALVLYFSLFYVPVRGSKWE